jgi:Alkylmercury lyase
VFAGRPADQRAGPSKATRCRYINFFATSSGASGWARAHPRIDGGILSHARALEVSEQIFGQLPR